MQNTFEIKKNSKVRFLNFFRKVFTFIPLEKVLVKLVLNKSNTSYIRKLIPPNYIYDIPSPRHVSRDGILFNLDISNVNDHFIFFGYHDEHFETIPELISPESVIFDIGSNIGQSALYFQKHLPGSSIYSFEPHPDTYNRALANIQMNNSSMITLENLGLGDKKETIKLFEVNPHNIGMNRALLDESLGANYNSVSIKVDTLDNYVSNNSINEISLIKIDVEGYEYNVLQGSENTILENKPVMLIEVVDSNLKECNSSASELVKLILDWGYQINDARTGESITSETNTINCHMDIICRAKQ